jgi:hypothetical protein
LPQQNSLGAAAVLRFTVRELLWVTLAFAALVAWQLEARQASHWREQAEHALSMLEAQTLENMALGAADPSVAPSYDAPLRTLPHGDQLPLGTTLLNAALGWLP